MAAEPLSRTDLQIAELMTAAGVSKNVAKAFMFLTSIPEGTSAEIEGAIRLRQPEVSVAMQNLRERGWVTKRDRRGPGKGRPVHVYSVTVSLEQVLAEIEAGERAKIDSIRTNLNLLRELVGMKVKGGRL